MSQLSIIARMMAAQAADSDRGGSQFSIRHFGHQLNEFAILAILEIISESSVQKPARSKGVMLGLMFSPLLTCGLLQKKREPPRRPKRPPPLLCKEGSFRNILI